MVGGFKKQHQQGLGAFRRPWAEAHSSDQCFPLRERLEERGLGRSFGEYFISEEGPLVGWEGGEGVRGGGGETSQDLSCPVKSSVFFFNIMEKQ